MKLLNQAAGQLESCIDEEIEILIKSKFFKKINVLSTITGYNLKDRDIMSNYEIKIV